MIQKTPAEIVLIKKACEITRNALIFAKSLVKEGISTFDIDKSLEKFIIDSGGSPACLGYEGYPAAPPGYSNKHLPSHPQITSRRSPAQAIRQHAKGMLPPALGYRFHQDQIYSILPRWLYPFQLPTEQLCNRTCLQIRLQNVYYCSSVQLIRRHAKGM